MPAGKETPSAVVTPRYSFNVLEQTGFIRTSQACMAASLARCKNRPTGFKTLAEIRREMLPWREFMMQYVMANFGIPHRVIVDIMGPEHVGKTTLVHWILGGAMACGCPTYLQETEAKPFDPGRAMRCFHTNPKLAMAMLKGGMLVEPVNSLRHSADALINWVDTMRGRNSAKGRDINVPIDTPLVAAIDTWSKLMNPKEAVGRDNYADYMTPAKMKDFKELGTGSNMGHAKWAAEYCRTLPAWLRQNNVILLLVRHQYDKVDMSGQASYNPEAMNLRNTSSTGGRSFNQSAAIQMILQQKAVAKEGTEAIGKIIQMRVNKNSYGPDGRKIEWTLKTENFHDTPTYIEPALQFEEYMAKLFADERYLGVQADGRQYSCDLLNVTAGTAKELAAAFHANEAIKQQLGKEMKIEGYFDYVDHMQSVIDANDAQEAAVKEQKKAQEKAAKEKEKNGTPAVS